MYTIKTIWTYNTTYVDTPTSKQNNANLAQTQRPARIQFSLDESPFHKELIKQISRKGRNTKNIIKALDDLELKTNWDTWDLSLENMELWKQAYNYSHDKEWRLWLADCFLIDILDEKDEVSTWDLMSKHEVIKLYSPELKVIDWPEAIQYIKEYLYETTAPVELGKIHGLGEWGWFLYHPDVKIGYRDFDKLRACGLPEFEYKELEIILNCCPEISSARHLKKYAELFKFYSDAQASIGIDLVETVSKGNMPELKRLAIYLGYLVAEGTDSQIDDILTPSAHKKFSKIVTKHSSVVAEWIKSLNTDELDAFILRLNKEPNYYKNEAAKQNVVGLYLYSELRREISKQPALAALLDINKYTDLIQASDYVHLQDTKHEIKLEPLPEIR